LRERWGLTIAETGWLTTVVQLGFVAGTACATGAQPRRRDPGAPLLPGLGAAGRARELPRWSWSPVYTAALASRFMTGFFLAGVYPPAMKMISTWFRSLRGLAIGTVVGALTVGKATPYLVHAANACAWSRRV